MLRTLCLLLAVFNAMTAAVLGVLVLFAQDELGLSESGYGLLLVVFAVGALLGMAVSSPARRRLGTSGVVVTRARRAGRGQSRRSGSSRRSR